MKYEKILTKDFLKKEYLENKKSAYQLALELNSSVHPIYCYLKKHNISIRTNVESHKKYRVKNFYYCKESKCQANISVTTFKYGQGRCRPCADKNHSKLMKENNPQKGKVGKLSVNYKHGKTNEIKYCQNCKRVIKNYYAKRCKSCATKYRYLNNPKSNPGYIHGNSKAPYSSTFSKELKLKIRRRDYYTCQHCGLTEGRHLLRYGYYLVIHHINYNKKNNKESNLITLCSSCNIKVNFNRDYWEIYFKTKLRGGNEY